MNKQQQIIEILSENTEWFDRVQEDLIHEGKFDSIANEIVELFAIPIIGCTTCEHDGTDDGLAKCVECNDDFHLHKPKIKL